MDDLELASQTPTSCGRDKARLEVALTYTKITRKIPSVPKDAARFIHTGLTPTNVAGSELDKTNVRVHTKKKYI